MRSRYALWLLSSIVITGSSSKVSPFPVGSKNTVEPWGGIVSLPGKFHDAPLF
jgi:hypothetical protein